MPNSVDLPRCANLWSEQDKDLYNKLPVWMAKLQVEYLQWYSRWTKILKPIKWQANMGNTMQGVRKVPSPVLRAQAFPNAITTMPKKDVVEVRETSERCQLYRHNFESQLMQFQPSFADFLTDHVEATNKDLAEKVKIYEELFYRTAIFHAAPYVWLCGKAPGTELTAVNYWTGATITEAKTQATRQALVAQVTKGLDLSTMAKINTVMYTDMGITPFSGKNLGDGTDGSFLKQKYLFISGSEVWDNFHFDPYLLANRMIDLDIVTDVFRGSLFGRWTGMPERHEMRIAADGTIPAPETVEENPNAYNYGETLPNPAWVNAPFAVAWGAGGEGYKSVQVGPPPKDFSGGSMSIEKFNGLDWNGKVEMTRNVMIPCLDQNNALAYDTNKRGEFLQLLSDIAVGILPVQRRNIIPIIYRRTRVGN